MKPEIKKYQKVPVVIEAYQWNKEIIDPNIRDQHIETLEGRLKVNEGDWVITGIKGEKYPCRDDIFRATYKEVK